MRPIWVAATDRLFLGSGGVLSSTGALAAPANSYAFTVQVTDSAGNVATQALTVVVQPPLPPLQITNTTLPNATSGQPYSTTLTAAGGSGAGYTWTLSSGFLPAGFTLSSTGGLISTGIPAASANLYVVTAQVTDSAGNLAQKAFTLLTTSPVAQACVAPPQGILAWWPFDETAGPTAADLVGGRTGTYFGTPPPLPAPGQVNNALSFGGSGAGDFVGVASDPVWGFGFNDFSIEFWANFNAAPGRYPGEPGAIFIGVDQGPGVVNKWFFATGGALEFVSYNAAVPGPIFLEFAPFAPTVGQWYHLALTKSGSLFTAYVNGNPAGSVSATVDVPGLSTLPHHR